MSRELKQISCSPVKSSTSEPICETNTSKECEAEDALSIREEEPPIKIAKLTLEQYGEKANIEGVAAQPLQPLAQFTMEAVDFTTAKSQEPPYWFSWRAMKRNLTCLLISCCSISIGYQGTLLNALLTNDEFRYFFEVQSTGTRVGIVTAMYQIGAFSVLPFLGLYLDKWGRRLGIFIGAVAALVGAIIQSTTSPHRDPYASFMAGRFFLGAGFATMTASSPVYIAEIAHPAQRGIVAAFYSSFWVIGSIIASAATRGSATLFPNNNRSWEIPTSLQLVFPSLIALCIWTLPESPRWLYAHGKKAEAAKIIVEYHGEGCVDSLWVRMQMAEYEKFLSTNGSDTSWWEFTTLFQQKSSRRRLFCACAVAIFGQCSGNGAISNFISGVLNTAGISQERQQMNINLGLSSAQLAFAIIGSCFVDKFVRRTLLLMSNAGLTVIWTAVVVSAALWTKTGSEPASISFIILIFVFSAIFAAGFTPVQALYPSEVLSYEMRAKGMAIVSSVQFAATLVNQFAYSILLAQVGWRLFIFFAIWCLFQLTIVYFFIPETKNMTLERMEEIFDHENPVQGARQQEMSRNDRNSHA